MANVLFTRKNASEIPNVPITDGQLIFSTSGNGKMYLDNGTERLEMGGALTVDATLSKTSTNPVQNKAVAGVMLDTLSDISNVTSKGFLTDALAVKQLNTNVNELNNSLGGLKFGKDGDGNYGYYGADGSLIPFSQISIGKFTAVNGTKTINVGFKPKAVIIMSTRAGTFFENVYYYDANNDLVVTGFWDSSSSWGIKSLTPTGFTYKYDSSFDLKYIAFKSNQGFPLKANADNIFK